MSNDSHATPAAPSKDKSFKERHHGFWKWIGNHPITATVCAIIIIFFVFGMIGNVYDRHTTNVVGLTTENQAAFAAFLKQQSSEPAAKTKVDVSATDPAADPDVAPIVHKCMIEGAVWVAAVDGCVQHVTQRAEIEPISPTVPHGPRCQGQPIGYKFDVAVTSADGRKGVAHHVCQ